MESKNTTPVNYPKMSADTYALYLRRDIKLLEKGQTLNLKYSRLYVSVLEALLDSEFKDYKLELVISQKVREVNHYARMKLTLLEYTKHGKDRKRKAIGEKTTPTGFQIWGVVP